MTTYKILQAGRIGSIYYNVGDTPDFPPAQVKYLLMQGRLEPLGAVSVAPKAKSAPTARPARPVAPVKRVLQVRGGEEL